MASRILVWLALLMPLGAAAASGQATSDPATCIRHRLNELGYSLLPVDSGSTALKAQRRVGGATAALKEASSLATTVATLGFIQPLVERRFDELSISDSGGADRPPPRVAAALVILHGEESRRRWPRAQAVIEAYQITARCSRRQ